MPKGDKDHYFQEAGEKTLQGLAQRIGEIVDNGVGRDGLGQSAWFSADDFTRDERLGLLGLGGVDRFDELAHRLNPEQMEMLVRLREWRQVYEQTAIGHRKIHVPVFQAMKRLGLEGCLDLPLIEKEDLSLPSERDGLPRGRVVEE